MDRTKYDYMKAYSLMDDGDSIAYTEPNSIVVALYFRLGMNECINDWMNE